MEEECFSSKECREHFKVVSKNSFERRPIEKAIKASLTNPKNVAVNQEATEELS